MKPPEVSMLIQITTDYVKFEYASVDLSRVKLILTEETARQLFNQIGRELRRKKDHDPKQG